MLQRNQISKVIARAWKDPAFKKKLLSNPIDALKEIGITVPEGVAVKIVEDDNKTFTLVLPPSPLQVKVMSDVELEKLAGGVSTVWTLCHQESCQYDPKRDTCI